MLILSTIAFAADIIAAGGVPTLPAMPQEYNTYPEEWMKDLSILLGEAKRSFAHAWRLGQLP